MVDTAPTEHQVNWWGTQKCRRCNSCGYKSRKDMHPSLLPACPDCDGTGWTQWAALATEPHTKILPNLFMGGHDYNCSVIGHERAVADEPTLRDFDVVISMYANGECVPAPDVEHHERLFNDGRLDPTSKEHAHEMALLAADRVLDGYRVLVRCQAGLNRSGLVTGLAMMYLGYDPLDAIQLLRAKRSPWVLCNEFYVAYLRGVPITPLDKASAAV